MQGVGAREGEEGHAKLTRANCPFSNVAMIIQWAAWGEVGECTMGGGRIPSLKSFRANYKTLSRQAKYVVNLYSLHLHSHIVHSQSLERSVNPMLGKSHQGKDKQIL